ncbi:transcription factor S-II, central domain-containing protein [Cantharellus anzutake]|uniref:transcription factor S-II, central domain-containing protein n=1 Tax=Cantharellus anzutake TaxID=1750568 RepID=UPI0019053CC0|nr:transcription factor S-II, central domain-containing protein [Cantharellus anzutake]KAF8323552.1 transcription factor S-II, central domain-containing protein [Cantharellus anzutake]
MYCLRKLQEVITPIFCESAAHEPDYSNSASLEGVSYVKELEQHLFQAFRETDKAGNILVGNKYKTQFRMLAFNLEKSDRVSLRQSIRTGRMTAAELSVMSNSELASDQQKKEIETAQKESLEHSILDGRQMNRPLRKITHKGEEEIEDMDRDDDASRTRSVRGDSILYFPSAPSSEPSPTSDDPKFAILPSRKLVTSGSSASGVGGGEPEAFATPQSIGPPESTVSSSFAPSPTASAHPISLSTDVPPSIVASPTSKRFDLSSLGWAESDHHSAPPALETESPEEHPGAPPSAELDTGEDARSDHDFNMFIEPEHERNELTPAEVRDSGVLQSSPPAVVWKGELRMPGGDGSTMSTEIASYLIAGRPKGYQDFSFWSSMFPRPFVRVDGRVNIDAANTYLLNSRLNTGRELVAVEMVPSDPQHEATFNEIVAVLTSKRRHGVVFPWGNPAPPDAPGKELYLVPLQPSDPVPEYLQLLDHVQLPDVRTATVVLGFFILHRSKVSIAQPATNIPVSAQATRENGTASNVLQPSVPSGIDISSITAEYLAGILQNPALNQTLNPTAPPSSVMALYPQSSNTDTPNSGAPGPSQPLTLAQTLYSGPSTPAVINQQMGRFRGDAQSSSRGRPYENYSRGRRYALDGSRGRGRGRNAGWGHANYSPVDNGWGNRRSSGSGGSGGIRY